MAYDFSAADVRFLGSAAGRDALAAIAGFDLAPASWLADVSSARALFPGHAPALLETVVLRRKARVKLAGADDWLLTDAALQQATPTPVALHRAQRLRGRDVHDVTCSVGADLAVLSTVARRCIGSDLDPIRLAMARHNCAVVGADPLLVRADALRPVSSSAVVVADPARRDGTGRRAWRLGDLMPPLDELVAAHPGRDLAVKCSPGMDFGAAGWADEVELVSLDGRVREACLWRGSLATSRRRATVLRSGLPSMTVTDADPDDCPVSEVGAWIVDPDGAVVRAGLVRHYAARHGLAQLDPHIAYLTGDTPPPGIRALRVVEHGRYGEKALRAALRRHDVGALEILVRGLDVDPDALRSRLKPAGSTAATVVLTRVGRTPTAVLCRASP
ncbi:MAG: class I SAM-dependent methyltransferase [Kutzneria sp.]|nr:class I SAM-dependent methyltransferase [Kutzneria sp.]